MVTVPQISQPGNTHTPRLRMTEYVTRAAASLRDCAESLSDAAMCCHDLERSRKLAEFSRIVAGCIPALHKLGRRIRSH